jgi:hypothetical protein
MNRPKRRTKTKSLRNADRKTPSAATAFEMRIRADRGLNVTTRLLWLLCALSHKYGFTFLTEAEMARQLNTSVRQVQISLRAIIAAGYFRQVRPRGIHRPLQYHRVLLENETPDEFVRRVQSDVRFDICTLLHWVASDETAKSGRAQFAAAQELGGVSDKALRLARRKMTALGHFQVSSTPLRGAPAVYKRVNTIAVDPANRVKEKTAPANRPAETVLSKAEVRRRDGAALELGLYGPARPLQPVKKRVIRFTPIEEE